MFWGALVWLQPNRFSIQVCWHIWAEPLAPVTGVTLRKLGASLRVSSPGFGWLDTNLFPFSESSLDPIIEGRSLKGKKVVNQGLAVASYSLHRKTWSFFSQLEKTLNAQSFQYRIWWTIWSGHHKSICYIFSVWLLVKFSSICFGSLLSENACTLFFLFQKNKLIQNRTCQ